MPHKEAYDYNLGCGTWETARSAFAPGAAEEVVRVSVDILNDMAAGNTPSAKRLAGNADGKKTTMASLMTFAGKDWYILENKSGAKLLLSKNILDIMPYNCPDTEPASQSQQFGDNGTLPEKNAATTQTAVTWKTSSLRAYLNSEFLEKAFSDKERELIIPVQNLNNSNSKYGISGGNPTTDRVFCLSIEEAELYLGGFGDMLKAVTEDGQKLWWHLRTPGEAADVNACVDANGLIDYHGISDSLQIPQGGVRPALWIRG